MNNYLRKIEELKNSIARNRSTIAKQLVLLGEHLVELPSEQIGGTPLEEDYAEAAGLMEEKNGHQDTIDRITDCQSRLERIALDMKDNLSAVKEQSESMEPYLDEIGQAAYMVFKQRRDEAEQYYTIFAELAETEAKINGIEQDVDETDDKPKAGIFGKIRNGGKRFIQEGILRSKRKYLEKQYHPVGRRVVDSNFFESFPSIQLEKAMRPISDMKSRIRDLQAQYAELEGRHETVEDELRDIVNQIPGKSPVSVLERKVADIEEMLSSTFRRIGETYRDAGLSGILGGPKLEGSLRIIEHLQTRNEAYEGRIRRLEAAIEIESLEERKAEAEAKIRSKEETIRRLEAEIGDIRNEIVQLEEEMETMTGLRGPEETLLSDESEVPQSAPETTPEKKEDGGIE